MVHARLPSVFVTHGGGPMPLLGDPAHAALTASLVALPHRLGLAAAPPAAVLLVSAHYEKAHPTVLAHPPERLIYDYGGFPEAAYKLQYRPPGAPHVADALMHLLGGAGFSPRLESPGRGLDHGAFVPLMLMFPEASVPVVELSIMSSLSPEEHIRMGEALKPLRDQGVLVVGSGSSYHNVPAMMCAMVAGGSKGHVAGQRFDDWLADACTRRTGADRAAQLSRWASAPGAAEAHPRAEHLMPLLVAAGAGGGDAGWADRVVAMGGVALSSFVFGWQQPAAVA